jgi:hypothetical protein
MAPRSCAPFVVTVLLLLPLLYVGSYFALVVPAGYFNGRLNISSTMRPPNYRIGAQQAAVFFWPLEQIDRRLRPEAWELPWEKAGFFSGVVFDRLEIDDSELGTK